MAVHSWISFVKQYAKNHNLTYKEALKKASPEYRKYKSMKKKPIKKRMKKKHNN